MPRPKKPATPKTKVEKYDPTDPLARDEGPRMIRLPDQPQSVEGYTAHYLALADLALGTGDKKKKKKHAGR